MTQNSVSSAVALRNDSASAIIDVYREDLAAIMPSHIKPDVYMRLAVSVLARDENLMRAAQNNPASLMAALWESSRLGLMPGTEEYYLTVRKNRGVPEILGITGYQGEIELIYRAGAVSSVIVEVVRVNDVFVWKQGSLDTERPQRWVGPQVQPYHEIDWDADPHDRGPLRLVYAYAVMKDGAISRVVVLNRKHIEEAKEFSAGGDKDWSPWRKHEEGMWLKGLALDTPIATPSGWSTMANLRVGDDVFDMHGKPTRVLATSPVKHLDCYRVTFANGTSIVCDAEHLWVAGIGGNWARKGWQVYEVSDLFEARESGKQITVPVAEPLDTPEANLPIDPWLLGYWLGDGNRTRPSVTCSVDTQHEVTSAIASAGYELGAVRRDPRSNAVDVYIRGGFGKQLAEAGLLGHKHVPAEYMRASVRQRLALLRGLLDSDGGLSNKRGRAYFYNTDAALADAVAELARSLGEMVNVIKTPTTGYGKTVIAYRVSWQPSIAPVTLSSKLAHYRPREVAAYRSVRTIERITSVPTRCISVDSPSRTFLAGVDMTPTHNTGAHRLRKWVPTSAEYMREQLRAIADVEAEVDPAARAVPGQRPGAPVEELTAEDFKAMANDSEDVEELTHALGRAQRAGFAQPGDELFVYFLARKSALEEEVAAARAAHPEFEHMGHATGYDADCPDCRAEQAKLDQQMADAS